MADQPELPFDPPKQRKPRKRTSLEGMDAEERRIHFETLEWSKAKRTVHADAGDIGWAPKSQQVSVSDFDDEPDEKSRADARALADEARAVWRSQFRKG